MLARAQRITHGGDYKRVVRRGFRRVGRFAVVYVMNAGTTSPARFGFIANRQLGGAVVRNRIRRQLKAICADAASEIEDGTEIIIRVFPDSRKASFTELKEDITALLLRRVK